MWNSFSKIPSGIDNLAASTLKLFYSGGKSASETNRLEKLIRVLEKRNPVNAFHFINQTYTAAEAQKLLIQQATHLATPFDENSLFSEENDPLSRVLATEYKTYMVDDILQKVDRATMSASLEGREPFLDQRIIELVSRLPTSYKHKDGTGKFLLREIVHKHVPKELMERPKMGFGVPVEKWLKDELKDFFEDTFHQNANSDVFDILNRKETENLKTKYLGGQLEYFERLWYVFSFMTWYKRWMA
jgi:asparagine synthase (glutamine-hydrolysing)